MDPPLTNSKLSNDIILQKISRTFIKPPAELCLNNNKVVEKFKLEFIQNLKEADPDFEKCNPHIKACGSYYKKTKVGKPDEYDLNLILNLPFDYSKCQISTDKRLPGFVKIYVKDAYTDKWRHRHGSVSGRLQTKNDRDTAVSSYPKTKNRTFFKFHRTSLEKKIVDPKSGCLDQEKFRRWIESLITKASMQRTYLQVDSETYTVYFRKSGPAQTAYVCKGNENIMSIDFVPCLEFTKNLRDFREYNKNETMKWLAVPKLYRFADSQNVLPVETNLFWRTSFYAYEVDILKRKNNHGAVNEVIRFMKKMRSKYNWDSKLPSYYLETLFFNEIENKKTSFERRSRTQIFVHMLYALHDCLKNKKIEFFWNRKFNLLENHKEVTLVNLSGQISRIIANINKNINNYNEVLAETILTTQEYSFLMRPDFGHNQDVEALTNRIEAESPSRCVIS